MSRSPSQPVSTALPRARRSRKKAPDEYVVHIQVATGTGLPSTSGISGHDGGGIPGGSTGGGTGPIHFPNDVVLSQVQTRVDVKLGGSLEILLPITPEGMLMLSGADGAPSVKLGGTGSSDAFCIRLQISRVTPR